MDLAAPSPADPRPTGWAGKPSRVGRKARCIPHLTFCIGLKRCCSVRHMALSRAAAYLPDSDGGTVRTACCARGLVQYSKRSHAHCRSGSCLSSCSNLRSACRRSSKRRRTKSTLPIRTPSAKKPRSAAFAAPHQTSGPSSAMPGGGGPGTRAFCQGR